METQTMASLIENFRDADGQPVQPYFAAFMIERGFRTAKEAMSIHLGGFEYMTWNQARWKQFEAAHGYQVDGPRRHLAAQFTTWLNDRALDHAARRHVEAA